MRTFGIPTWWEGYRAGCRHSHWPANFSLRFKYYVNSSLNGDNLFVMIHHIVERQVKPQYNYRNQYKQLHTRCYSPSIMTSKFILHDVDVSLIL